MASSKCANCGGILKEAQPECAYCGASVVSSDGAKGPTVVINNYGTQHVHIGHQPQPETALSAPAYKADASSEASIPDYTPHPVMKVLSLLALVIVIAYFIYLYLEGSSKSEPHPLEVARWGPTWEQAEQMFSHRISRGETSAQRELYEQQRQRWGQQWFGTKVRWTGELRDVGEIAEGGKLRLRCGPETFTSDTEVWLDGSQTEHLPRMLPGAKVLFVAILRSHDTSGYTLSHGRLINYWNPPPK